ncbi:hypothetical protein [Polaribacter porphyrae]|uniref:Uncharacterized protein n=1 Tax=Polaribacter porphyrae TaxID=1137780 RepID=A0A2S7WRR6_9FLAO|nr:hypothetical protein [Polaribacter porphyrae]PQJ80274.1 hypothetical protein BTO18_14280 [Polaribacter porphyrae]
MGTVELKNKLVDIINSSDDKFLRMVNALHISYSSEEKSSDFYDELPAEIQDLLMESRLQARQGKVRPHKKVMADFRKQYGITG